MSPSASTAAGRRRTTARPSRGRAAGMAGRRAPRFSRPRLPRAIAGPWHLPAHIRSLPRRALIVAIVGGALAIAYFAWFRDSSLVAVRDVKVEGVTSSDRSRIVDALTHAGRRMTTLHVQTDRLMSAVRDLPTVTSVSADASFPHGLTIHVTERPPVLVASDGGRDVPVAADGSLLPGISVEGHVAQLPVDSLPDSGRLSGEALAEALVIGAAPAPLRPLIDTATVSRDYGVVVTMHGGIELRFGAGADRKQKWVAAAAVLSGPSLTSLTYIDVRIPGRPAVGGTSDPSPATGPPTLTPAAP